MQAFKGVGTTLEARRSFWHKKGHISRRASWEVCAAEDRVAIDGSDRIADADQIDVDGAVARPPGRIIGVPSDGQLGIVIEVSGKVAGRIGAGKAGAIDHKAVLVVDPSRIARLRDREI